MTLVRVGRLVAVLAIVVAEFGCGDTFRPVVIPISTPPPNPASVHYAVVLSTNGVCNLPAVPNPPLPNAQCNPGAASRIDVSGDSVVNSANVGLNPVHAVLLPNENDVYVANQLEDTVSFYDPSGSGPVSTVTLPPGSGPVFLAVHTNTVYVADAGNNTVSTLPIFNNVVTNTTPVGLDPVALAVMPNGQKVYVANHGSGPNPVNGTVMSINTVDSSVNPPISPPAGSSWNAPTWVVARPDNARVYVLDQGTGVVAAINTTSDTVMGTALVGAGANFMQYDQSRTRLYVTNPVAGTMVILDASTNPPNSPPTDPLTILATFNFAGVNAPCPGGCTPVSVAALSDGSRAYVASYQVNNNTCSNPAQTPPCITAWLTVINASSNTVTKTISLGVVNPNAPIAVPPTFQPDTPVPTVVVNGAQLAVCASARFRLFAAASGDNSRVYVSYCDAGGTESISTVPNTSPGTQNGGDYLVNELTAPFSACASPGCGSPPTPGGEPVPQNPVFVLPGP